MQISSREIAKQFVHDQIVIIKKYGTAPKLTATQMKELLASTQASFESLGSRQEKK